MTKAFFTLAIAGAAVAQQYWDSERSHGDTGYFSSPTHEGTYIEPHYRGYVHDHSLHDQPQTHYDTLHDDHHVGYHDVSPVHHPSVDAHHDTAVHGHLHGYNDHEAWGHDAPHGVVHEVEGHTVKHDVHLEPYYHGTQVHFDDHHDADVGPHYGDFHHPAHAVAHEIDGHHEQDPHFQHAVDTGVAHESHDSHDYRPFAHTVPEHHSDTWYDSHHEGDLPEHHAHSSETDYGHFGPTDHGYNTHYGHGGYDYGYGHGDYGHGVGHDETWSHHYGHADSHVTDEDHHVPDLHAHAGPHHFQRDHGYDRYTRPGHGDDHGMFSYDWEDSKFEPDQHYHAYDHDQHELVHTYEWVQDHYDAHHPDAHTAHHPIHHTDEGHHYAREEPVHHTEDLHHDQGHFDTTPHGAAHETPLHHAPVHAKAAPKPAAKPAPKPAPKPAAKPAPKKPESKKDDVYGLHDDFWRGGHGDYHYDSHALPGHLADHEGLRSHYYEHEPTVHDAPLHHQAAVYHLLGSTGRFVQ